MSKKVFGIILNILIIIALLIVAIIIYGVIQTKVIKKDYANFAGYTIFQVATGSMSPTMEEQDIIIIKFLNEEQIKKLEVDEIIIYREADYTVTHRIIEIGNDSITTKGDANNSKDTPIKANDVVGKVVKIIPNIGVWEKVFTTPKVYISIIITITLWGITLLYKPQEKIKSDGEKIDEGKTTEKEE